jgi:threonine dehydrogenase-like Zn-dependent dehydrogenase
MSPTRVRAAVQVASKRTELRDFALPEIPPDAGLLRVLAAGICGSDIPAYDDMSRGPRILGHENVGTIERLGDVARERWGVSEGDLVIDVSSGSATDVVGGALRLLRKRGKLLVAAYKGKPIDGFALDAVIADQLMVRGVRGHSFRAVELALRLMEEHSVELAAMSTHEFGLDGVDRALRLVAGELDRGAIHVTVAPWRRESVDAQPSAT